MIEIFNASVETDKRYLLQEINLKINKGEFVYLIV